MAGWLTSVTKRDMKSIISQCHSFLDGWRPELLIVKHFNRIIFKKGIPLTNRLKIGQSIVTI